MSLRLTGTLVACSALTAAISLAIAGEPNPAIHKGLSLRLVETDTLPIDTETSQGPMVFTCADAGPGSLRAAVSVAHSGDTIDITQLSCSKITTTTGAIIVAVDDLAITGPGETTFTVENGSDAAHYDGRLFDHTGSGTLALSGMTVQLGYAVQPRYGTVSGGCIRSKGSITLQSTKIEGCSTRQVAGLSAFGGAVYTRHDLSLRSSKVTLSKVNATRFATGGGVFVDGNFYARDSSLANNWAFSSTLTASGGGAFVHGDADIERSSIVGNYSGSSAGFVGNVGGATFEGSTRIVNSLVANNRANGFVGGIYDVGHRLTLHSSTISGNTATESLGPSGVNVAAGLYLYKTVVDLKSTIIADNTFGNANPFDLSGVSAIVLGSSNLVMNSTIAPPGTSTADPKLGPPSFANGRIFVPLLPGSPAIDHGSNSDALATDARGAGFPRIVGSAPDIGAYEVQVGLIDTIFADGFN